MNTKGFIYFGTPFKPVIADVHCPMNKRTCRTKIIRKFLEKMFL